MRYVGIVNTERRLGRLKTYALACHHCGLSYLVLYHCWEQNFRFPADGDTENSGYTFHCTIVIYLVDILIIINKYSRKNTLADLFLFGFRREHHTQPIVTPADNDGTF